MSRRREVNDEEQTLWRVVTRTVKPLKGKRSAPEPKGVDPKPTTQGRRKPSMVASPVAKPRPPVPKAPPLASIDRRARQRLSRGTQSIDGRLDLHGRTQAQAHAVLLRFLRGAQADGAKMVLVITGKGVASEGEFGERGVLRRQVPLWLALPEFRGLVVGFSPAAHSHGGDGALYVRVRKERPT